MFAKLVGMTTSELSLEERLRLLEDRAEILQSLVDYGRQVGCQRRPRSRRRGDADAKRALSGPPGADRPGRRPAGPQADRDPVGPARPFPSTWRVIAVSALRWSSRRPDRDHPRVKTAIKAAHDRQAQWLPAADTRVVILVQALT
jgi:hypothetical protein